MDSTIFSNAASMVGSMDRREQRSWGGQQKRGGRGAVGGREGGHCAGGSMGGTVVPKGEVKF